MLLHIGGRESKDGWKILNAQTDSNVDYVGDIRDLSFLPDKCCEIIYASHVLEHVNQRDMVDTLIGVRRLLEPGGRLLVSVPDLDILCRFFIHEGLNPDAKFEVMRMMFGGQRDDYDFHFIGLSFEILSNYLEKAGFASVQRVKEFGIFKDMSTLAPLGVPISLNIIAVNVS